MSTDLFGKPPTRAARRVLMHAVDSGSFPDGKDAAHFMCNACLHDNGWTYATRTEMRRGFPCPNCNDPVLA